MKCKIYATDEGFGPLVRQSAVIEELRALQPDLDITFQTHGHVADAEWILQDVTLVDRFNNISWSKHPDGSPDVKGIREAFVGYEGRSDAFIERELQDFDYDFVISDFVYEAFPVAREKGVPVFGIAHFPWDWFFAKLFPPPLTTGLLDRFAHHTELADVLYFPPLTPKEVLHRYATQVREVPLIVRKHNAQLPEDLPEDKFRVLVMGSGSQVLKEHVNLALRRVGELEDMHFFISSEFDLSGDNVTYIRSKEFLIDYIPHVDLVIARAGFNTISECIAFRTPMLLVGEAMNPEMSENMMNVKHEGLGSFVSLEHFARNLNQILPRFREREYPSILHAMQEHQIPTDGARVVAEDILRRVESAATSRLRAYG
jgi:uncharacterized protein (TIGR00661 family)